MVLAPSVAGLFKWRQFETGGDPACGGLVFALFAFLSRCGGVAGRAGACTPTTSPSGGGSNVTPQKFSGDCDRSSDRPTTAGGWMRPTSGLRANGCNYTGLSTRPVRRSTSFFRLNAMQRRPNDSSPKRWAERTIRRRGSSTPTSTPVIRRRLCNSKPKVLWRRIAGIARCSTSIMFWNRITGPSNAGFAPASISVRFGALGAQLSAMDSSQNKCIKWLRYWDVLYSSILRGTSRDEY